MTALTAALGSAGDHKSKSDGTGRHGSCRAQIVSGPETTTSLRPNHGASHDGTAAGNTYRELLARIANGEIIPPAEMAAKYYPLESDYRAVVDWLNFRETRFSWWFVERLDPKFHRLLVQWRAAMHIGGVKAQKASYLARKV